MYHEASVGGTDCHRNSGYHLTSSPFIDPSGMLGFYPSIDQPHAFAEA